MARPQNPKMPTFRQHHNEWLLALSILIFLAASVCSVYAHSGRTDKSGGHNDYINGGYHYHNSGTKGETLSSFVIFVFIIGSSYAAYYIFMLILYIINLINRLRR
ncbi:YHYH domain-containing protein [Candidatus Poribacteria bacterium]|nr:YHYH domain-containing protein [Candidatus Poribacteria bacterium]